MGNAPGTAGAGPTKSWGVALSWGDGVHLGNAKDWLAGAESAGYDTGDDPRADAIFVEDWGDGIGHVAFIEEIRDGRAYYTEGNYLGLDYHESSYDLATLVPENSYTPLSITGYIYLDAETETEGVSIDAQHFPDTEFRGYVKENCDRDGDGILSWRENRETREMTLYGRVESLPGEEPRYSGISDLNGIQYFTFLRSLKVGAHPLTTMDLSGNTRLRELEVTFTSVSSLKISACSSLRSIKLENNNQMTSLDLSGLFRLQDFTLYNGKMTQLDFSGCPEIRTITCPDGKLATLNLAGCAKLESVDVLRNQLTSLTLGRQEQLTSLSCAGNQIGALTLNQLPALTTLDCGGNQLTGLDLSGNGQLEYLSVGDNQLTSLDLSANPKLKSAFCYENRLTSLDVRQNAALEDLGCENNGLETLTLRSGTGLWTLRCQGNRLKTLSLHGCKNLTTLLCEKNEISILDLSECPGMILCMQEGSREEDAGEGTVRYTYTDSGAVKPAYYLLRMDQQVGTVLTDVEKLDTLRIPEGITEIEDEAFAGISAERVILPAGLKRIGKRAFAGCAHLKYVNIPLSVTDIDETAFEGCDGVCFTAGP